MIRTTVRLQNNWKLMQQHGYSIGLKGEALATFKYEIDEVDVVIEVDESTGRARIVGVVDPTPIDVSFDEGRPEPG